MGRKGCFLIFEQMRSLEQDLTFLSAKTEFDESNIPFKEKNLGIQKILDSYSESEFKPQFVTTENAFKIILPNLNYQKKNNKIQEDIVVYDCPENKILEFAKAHTQFNRKDVQDTFNLSQTTCGRILSRMKEEGQISQHGKGKNTFYILKEKK